MNPYQELLKALALSQNDNPIPFITNDAEVNHAIYCYENDQHTPFERQHWEKEIDDWARSGGLIVGWIKF